MSFVLDASITMAWFFKDERSDETEALFRLAIVEKIHVPVGWSAEVINTIIMGERRGRCTQSESTDFMNRLQKLDVCIDDGADTFMHLPLLCRKFRLTAYDAAYLELAIRLQLPLATSDVALRAAALGAGLPLL
jgi:predicted nucleic acid-binding protein